MMDVLVEDIGIVCPNCDEAELVAIISCHTVLHLCEACEYVEERTPRQLTGKYPDQ